MFKTQEGGILGLFNMFSGGALSRFTIFALGIMPYISASIIVQLMITVVPSFENFNKEGEQGRKKINQYTKNENLIGKVRKISVTIVTFHNYIRIQN